MKKQILSALLLSVLPGMIYAEIIELGKTSGRQVKRCGLGCKGGCKHKKHAVEPSSNLDSIINNNPYVVVDFYSTQCPPCKQLAKDLEKFESEFDKVVFVKINTSENQDLAREYKITNIPRVFYFKNGAKIDETTSYSTRPTKPSEVNPVRAKLQKHYPK